MINNYEEAAKYLKSVYKISEPTHYHFNKWLRLKMKMSFVGMETEDLISLFTEVNGSDKNMELILYYVLQHLEPNPDLKLIKSIPKTLNYWIRRHVAKSYDKCYSHVYKKRLVVSDGKTAIITFKPYFNKNGTVIVRPNKENARHIIGDVVFHNLDKAFSFEIPDHVKYNDYGLNKKGELYIHTIELDHVKTLLIKLNKNGVKY